MLKSQDGVSILPNIEKKLEQYATNFEKFSIYEYERCQIHWERESDAMELLHFEQSPMSTTLKVQRDPFTGEIVDFHEVPVQAVGATAQNSMLLNRAPIPTTKSIRGSASYLPFLPGSFFNDSLDIPKTDEQHTSELLRIPPGFSSGLTFAADGITLLKEDSNELPVIIEEKRQVINIIELAEKEQNLLGTWSRTIKEDVNEDVDTDYVQNEIEEEAVIPKEPMVLNISSAPPINATKCSDWAVILDASKPIENFDKKIPKMARVFDFELDTFQKLAILQVEAHNHVFVAAHTSAGKTVVAEYAIALSQQHRTKTIYTSPIKALSNQKYRDFKREFKDVGLITGDFQTNETASCLIMTTEILRSMLYGGSDTTRDLEYVIFDEVHYINDRERGHVWEQVLILLPPRVSIILLSATVPKPEEFADWLGSIRQKKVYVITTTKRPVPLHHFLYTGTNGKTKDRKFAILNDEQWCREGYIQARDSIPQDKKYDRRQFTEKQDKTLWEAMISHLTKSKLLPVVAFIFSRAKCDRNARNLSSVDLTDSREKHKIRSFYRKCIRNLSETDKNVPQVVNMCELLCRGVGVHHSGVLPIIKEIVEMLFQEGLIKLLFATETFAMGVNMPARTVIFDSISKHDGQEWRNLKPAEYIQMAGRAGRRSQDKKGTVIILCKNQLPEESILRSIMMGRPQLLESQFRLTYSMVLSLLRTESLTVENMMSQSFMEKDHHHKMVDLKEKLQEVEKKISELGTEELSVYMKPLIKYFDTAKSYLDQRKKHLGLHSSVYSHLKVKKVMTPGRVLLICKENHINKLAILLSESRGGRSYRVLVLTDNNSQSTDLDDKTNLWYKMLSLATTNVYCPVENISHEVIDIESLDILEITGRVIKVNAEFILNDWNKRQSLRFKNDPPAHSTIEAIQELHQLSFNVKTSDINILEYLHFIEDLHVNDTELYKNLQEMYILKDKMKENKESTKIPNFVEQFSIVFAKKYLEEEKADLEDKLSISSLTLYPDYQNRKALLKKYKYVDDNNVVQLKGKVACEMGMNELLITEIVVNNLLDNLEPAEVAAFLSTIVFQVKTRNNEEVKGTVLKDVTPALKEAIANLEIIHEKILNHERDLEIRSEDIQEELNFGVVMVVYHWASKKSFEEIMTYTDFQEGIIVRCIQQLNDTICDVRDAAKIIGNPALKDKMEEASNAIKRDIVFAASLYTQGVDVSIKS